MAQALTTTITTTVDKWDLIRMMADSAMSLRAEGAAKMLSNLTEHDPDTMYWVAKWIYWTDEYFADQVFAKMAVPPLLH